MTATATAAATAIEHTGSDGATERRIVAFMVATAAVVVPLEFSTVGLVSDGVDLARWAVTGLVVFATPALLLPRLSVPPIARLPFAPLFGWAVWTWLSTIWSITPRQSLVQGATVVGIALFCLTTMRVLGWDRWTQALLAGWTVFLGGGLLSDAADGSLFVDRSAGLSVAPTNLATICAVTILIAFTHVGRSGPRPLPVAAIGVAVVALWASGTRTPIAALALAGVVQLILTFVPRGFRLAAVAIAVAGFAVAISWSLGQEEFARGDGGTAAPEELETFTGRSFIWDAMPDLVTEAPVIGHGYATSPDLLRELARTGDMPFTTTDAHNLWLQLLIETGAVGLALFATFVVFSAAATHRARPDVFGLLVLLLANGLVESLNRPGASTMVFAAIAASIACERAITR